MLLQNTEKLSVLFVLVSRHHFQLRLHYTVCDYLFEIHIHDICLLTPKKNDTVRKMHIISRYFKMILIEEIVRIITSIFLDIRNIKTECLSILTICTRSLNLSKI